jgi:hypothetical protein
MRFQVGQILGDYQIVAILGAGGMGSVYKVDSSEEFMGKLRFGQLAK